MTDLGEAVIELLRSAERDVLVVAPFIRTHALERLLGHVPTGIQIKVVTRWRPADVVAGSLSLAYTTWCPPSAVTSICATTCTPRCSRLVTTLTRTQ